MEAALRLNRRVFWPCATPSASMASFPEYFAKAWPKPRTMIKEWARSTMTDPRTSLHFLLRLLNTTYRFSFDLGSVESGRASRSTRSTRFSTSTNSKLASLFSLLSLDYTYHTITPSHESRPNPSGPTNNDQRTQSGMLSGNLRFVSTVLAAYLASSLDRFRFRGQAAAPRENILSNMPIRRGDCT